MTDERLTTLFRCSRDGHTYAHRACLRRQLEGRACAKGCQQGAALRAELADIPAYACPRCRAAVIGAGAECEACAAKKAEKLPPRVLEQVRRGPSERIWTERLPDVPFVPPSEQRRDLVVADLESPPEPAGTAEAAPEIEAQSQEPEPMPTPDAAPEQRMCTQCNKTPLRSDNRSGWCKDCRQGRTVAELAAAAGKTSPKAAGAKKAAKTPRPKHSEADPQAEDLTAELSDDQLAQIAVAAAAEIRRRMALFDGALKALEQARRAA